MVTDVMFYAKLNYLLISFSSNATSFLYKIKVNDEVVGLNSLECNLPTTTTCFKIPNFGGQLWILNRLVRVSHMYSCFLFYYI